MLDITSSVACDCEGFSCPDLLPLLLHQPEPHLPVPTASGDQTWPLTLHFFIWDQSSLELSVMWNVCSVEMTAANRRPDHSNTGSSVSSHLLPSPWGSHTLWTHWRTSWDATLVTSLTPETGETETPAGEETNVYLSKNSWKKTVHLLFT